MSQLQIVGKPDSHTTSFARIEDAIVAIRARQMVIVVDNEDRENECDLTIAAEKITPEAINFMAALHEIVYNDLQESVGWQKCPQVMDRYTSVESTQDRLADAAEGRGDALTANDLELVTVRTRRLPR